MVTVTACMVPTFRLLLDSSIDILSFIGGLVCFSLRYNEVDDYQPKMTELEEAGIWEKLSGKKIPYYNREDMPSYGFGFVYKILTN